MLIFRYMGFTSLQKVDGARLRDSANASEERRMARISPLNKTSSTSLFFLRPFYTISKVSKETSSFIGRGIIQMNPRTRL